MAAKPKGIVQPDMILLFLLSTIPDALIALLIMKLTDDEWSTFWWVWIAIQVLYTVNWAKKALWSSVVWRLWLRRRACNEAFAIFQACRFPKPKTDEDDAQVYLTRLIEDDEQPVHVRVRAAEWRATIHANTARGLQSSLQITQAWRDGLEAYRRAELTG